MRPPVGRARRGGAQRVGRESAKGDAGAELRHGGAGLSPDAAGQPPADGAALLRVEGLTVEIPTEEGLLRAVDGISFELDRGRTLALVGESGAGKTMTALSIPGLSRHAGARIGGRILFAGNDLAALAERDLRGVRGNAIAFVFQDPLASLHPLHTIGWQVREALTAHGRRPRAQVRRRALELLELVGIPEAARRLRQYPHELSGGMRQRVMIAIAIANEPLLLIADEPTTALDATVQAQILALLERLQSELSMALLLITHDLGVVAEMADEVAVMYAGRIVERAAAQDLFAAPEHPYTWALLRSMPTLVGSRGAALEAIGGSPPDLLRPPSGCRFHPRCPYASPEHARIDPPLEPTGAGAAHEVACLLPPAERRARWLELRR